MRRLIFLIDTFSNVQQYNFVLIVRNEIMYVSVCVCRLTAHRNMLC
jgi:hypothetical protein